jgi:hypothetical protein
MAFDRIDAANGEDPNRIEVEGASLPAELVYGERMSAALSRLYPEASEALQLAARAQHLRRWTVARSSYPMNRPGYLRWRSDLKRKHAEWAGAILESCGYSGAEVARVASLIRKENLKTDPEAQALEDVAAIVFLESYAEHFARKHDTHKVVGILSKTFAKMSEHGRQAVAGLALPPLLRELLDRAARVSDASRDQPPNEKNGI